MGICFTPYGYDAARNLYTPLPAAHENSEDFALDVCNANGNDILYALDVDPILDGAMPIDTFANLVTAALRRHLGRRSPELAPAEVRGADKATLVFCGRREGYIEERLGDLARLVQRSRAIGATHIGWG